MSKTIPYLDLKARLLSEIHKQGGFVNAHCHLDRAYTLKKDNFSLTNKTLQEKWELVDHMKKTATVTQIYDRMCYALEMLLSQDVRAVGSFIDVDSVIKDKSMQAAQKVKEKYKKDIKIKFINQVLKGVVDKEARYWFDLGAQFVDIIGGLPGRDKGKEAEHLDILLSTAKRMKKMVHVHVDQLNTAKEKETELLAKKTKEYGLKNKVVAVHGVSLAAHPKSYRAKAYKLMKEAGIMVVCCPTAWIDCRRSEELSVTHNAIAPVEELVAAKVTVALGTDNIVDIYKPFSNGDMWTELRVLLEACHYYDTKQLVNIASVNGLKTLGI